MDLDPRFLDAIQKAVRCHFMGSDKTRLDFRDCMRTLRAELEHYEKQIAKDETKRITKP